jgi:hypothetical protein
VWTGPMHIDTGVRATAATALLIDNDRCRCCIVIDGGDNKTEKFVHDGCIIDFGAAECK